MAQIYFQVHLKSQFILNGVCIIWKGWLDLHRLDGIGSIEFDIERATVSNICSLVKYMYIVSQDFERFTIFS